MMWEEAEIKENYLVGKNNNIITQLNGRYVDNFISELLKYLYEFTVIH